MSNCYNCDAPLGRYADSNYCVKCLELRCQTCSRQFDYEFDGNYENNIIEGECWRCHTNSRIEHLENLVRQLTEASND